MNEEELNISMRKFLKTVGVGSQREIEQAVNKALEEKRIQGRENFPVKMTLEIDGLELKTNFTGEIRLSERDGDSDNDGNGD